MTHEMLRSLFLLAVAIRAAVSAPWQDNPDTCGMQGPVPNFSVQIAGGHDAENYAWPWMAGMYENDFFICGASVIDPYWVITAAHCIDKHPENYKFRVGSINRTETTPFTQIRIASEIFIHPEYNIIGTDKGVMVNDIALIKIKTPFDLSKGPEVNSVCLPTKDMGDEFKVGQNVTVTGWGNITKTEGNPDILQQVVLPIFNDTACNKTWDWLITNNMICAGTINNTKDPCKGDSGGPMVGFREDNQTTKQYYLIGIVSSGPIQCGDPIKEPGVYTRVSEYEEWIKTTMNKTGSTPTTPLPTTDPSLPTSIPTKNTNGKHPGMIVVYVFIGIFVLGIGFFCSLRYQKRIGGGQGGQYKSWRSNDEVTISVCTSAEEKNVSGLIEELRNQLGVDQPVKYQQLPYNNVSKVNVKKMGIDVMILCHSINNRRFAITDVIDSLYDTFLKNAESTLGNKKVGVIVHDFPTGKFDTKDMYNNQMDAFKIKQPTTFEKASLVLIAGRLNETPVQLPENGWEDINRFLTINGCDNFNLP